MPCSPASFQAQSTIPATAPPGAWRLCPSPLQVDYLSLIGEYPISDRQSTPAGGGTNYSRVVSQLTGVSAFRSGKATSPVTVTVSLRSPTVKVKAPGSTR